MQKVLKTFFVVVVVVVVAPSAVFLTSAQPELMLHSSASSPAQNKKSYCPKLEPVDVCQLSLPVNKKSPT